MASIAAAVAVNVATAAITSEIKGDGPAQIGSGTSPSLSPGPDMQINQVRGSGVSDFEDASFNKDTKEEEILAQLTQAGIDPADLDKYGVAGMAVGGYLNKARGGPLYREDGGGIFGPPADLASDASSGGFGAFLDDQDPLVQDAITGGIASIGTALLEKLLGLDDRKGSLVRTETLPGNSNRRRSALETTPIEGSSVIFANEGSALQRPINMNKVIESVAQANAQSGTRISDKDREFYSRLLEGATETEIVNFLAQAHNQSGTRISDKDLEYHRSMVQGMESGGALKRPMFMPNGGAMNGPGGPKDDLIPVMASNGEYMLSKAAVDAAGNGSHAKGIANLEKFNQAGNRRYG